MQSREEFGDRRFSTWDEGDRGERRGPRTCSRKKADNSLAGSGPFLHVFFWNMLELISIEHIRPLVSISDPCSIELSFQRAA